MILPLSFEISSVCAAYLPAKTLEFQNSEVDELFSYAPDPERLHFLDMYFSRIEIILYTLYVEREIQIWRNGRIYQQMKAEAQSQRLIRI